MAALNLNFFNFLTVLLLTVPTVFLSFAFIEVAIVSQSYDSQNNDYLDNVTETMPTSMNVTLENILTSKRPWLGVADAICNNRRGHHLENMV